MLTEFSRRDIRRDRVIEVIASKEVSRWVVVRFADELMGRGIKIKRLMVRPVVHGQLELKVVQIAVGLAFQQGVDAVVEVPVRPL